MSHLLPLSRVSRLIGQTRSALQQMIKDGSLATFDGQIELDELLRVFPDVKWEDDGEIKRVEEIKAKAFGKRIYERALPDKEVLAERLFELGKEFASAKSLLLHYDLIYTWLERKFDDIADEFGGAVGQRLRDLKVHLQQQIADAPREAERGRALLAEESVMRVMSAHVKVLPSHNDFFVEGNDTILEAALRAGVPLNYGCSNGVCGECKARVVRGQVKKVHPHDYVFKEAEKQSGAFLMCSCTAISDIEIEAAIAGADDIPQQRITTRVKQVETISEKMIALHLITPRSQRLRFLAGQSVTLTSNHLSADYYLASCPCEDRHLTVHVRRDNTPFARHVFEDLRKDEVMLVEGPHGHTVFKLDSRRAALFVAWEDGFAPIKSLIQHAMSVEVSESMTLYWAATEVGHYRENICRSWADAIDNFSYRPLDAAAGEAACAEAILADFPDMTRVDIYAAGPKGLLDALFEGARQRGLSELGWHGEVLL